MSSRALRKLQKEQEIEKQLAAVREAEAAQAEQDEESEEEEVQSQKKPLNAFNMLDGMDDAEEDDEEESVQVKQTPTITTLPPSRPKKKKKKAKKKDKANADSKPTSEGDLDDIDRALQELSTKNPDKAEADTSTAAHDIWLRQASKLFAIDTRNLNPVNEMKSLFGNIALESISSPARPVRRREQAQAQEGGLDLETALSGKQCLGTGGKELGPLAHRRNVFMQGKEEWPGATSGGLSMELAKDDSSVEKHYNIMHDKYYQETQFRFLEFVHMMEAQNLIGLLREKPYHIATLLQVSEIAKMQGDNFVSGDLIERALFSLGRSVHSTFGVAVKDGAARLSFSESKNREMYLAIWRYIRNLEQRGTWKTAFEWAKVLLQLDPIRDPYGVTLMIDQLALRGRQHLAFIEMCDDDAYGETWNHLPNIQISLALAHQRNRRPTEARQSLAVAMTKYPYILSELAKSLDIEPLPRTLWGKLPSTEAEALYTQLYVTRAKDLWNTPELTSLIVEVTETLDHYQPFIAGSRPAPKLEISLEEARHVMLLEIPALIGLLPRKFTTMRTSMSDPLPPTSSGDFTARAPAGVQGSGSSLVGNVFGAAGGAAGGILDRILGWWHRPANGSNSTDPDAGQQAALGELADQLGVPPEQAQDMLAEFLMDSTRLEHQDAGNALAEGLPHDLEEFMDDVRARLEASDSDDDLPELESIPGVRTPPNPMAATVEEDEDEDVRPRNPASSDALLVPADNDEPPSIVMSRPFQRQNTEPTNDVEMTNEPQRIQRWLLSAGYDGIQDASGMANYVNRLRVLPKQQRDWTIRMVEQKGGKDLAGRVRAAVGD